MFNTYLLSPAHYTEGESPHSRARQSLLSRLRRPLRAATFKMVEVASRSLAGPGLPG